MTTTTTTSVLLIGSIPLSSAKEVFLTTSAALPGRLQDLPDSETGFEATTSPGRRTASGGRPGERSTWTEIRLWVLTTTLDFSHRKLLSLRSMTLLRCSHMRYFLDWETRMPFRRRRASRSVSLHQWPVSSGMSSPSFMQR